MCFFEKKMLVQSSTFVFYLLTFITLLFVIVNGQDEVSIAQELSLLCNLNYVPVAINSRFPSPYKLLTMYVMVSIMLLKDN